MASLTDPTDQIESAQPLKKGVFSQTLKTDLRSPCPMINCLANHGYLPRDGRNVHSTEIYSAVRGAGVGISIATGFTSAVYNVHHLDPPTSGTSPGAHAPPQTSWLGYLFTRLNPLAAFGMRRPDQVDSTGRPVLDLNQLALPGVIEHDISLTRRDHQQPQGNNLLQKDLVHELLHSSTDGKFITRADLANYRKRRIAVQKEENPEAQYETFQHLLSCGEISLILDVLGDGEKVPLDYARAFLLEERLPLQEGWKPRKWWGVGFIELQISILKVWRLVGVNG